MPSSTLGVTHKTEDATEEAEPSPMESAGLQVERKIKSENNEVKAEDMEIDDEGKDKKVEQNEKG